jgi:hypothetical protein
VAAQKTPLTQIYSDHHNAVKLASHEARTSEFGFVSQNKLSAETVPAKRPVSQTRSALPLSATFPTKDTPPGVFT